MLGILHQLHRGANDKYFSLLNTASRSAMRLAINLLVARLTGADGYGVFVLLISLEVIWTTLLGAWVVTPLLSTASGLERARRDGLGRYAIGRACVWSILVGGPALAGLAWVGLEGVGAWTLIGFGAATLLQGVLLPIRGWRNLSFETWHVFWGDLVAVLVPVATVAGLAVAGHSDLILPGFWWSSAAAGVVAAAGMLLTGIRRLAAGKAPGDDARAHLRRLAVPITLGSIAYSAGSRLQPMVLASAAATVEVARFGGAMALVGPLRMLGMALSGVVRPRLTLYYNQDEIIRVRQLMGRVCGCILGLAVALGIVFASLGGGLTRTLLGDWFAEPQVVLSVGCWYAGVACVASFLVTGLQVQSDAGPGWVARTRTVASLASLALMWPACAFLGAEGAIGSMAVVETCFASVACLRWWRHDQEPVIQAAAAVASPA